VRSVIQNTAQIFSDLGAHVTQDHPNLDGAMEVFQTQRAAGLRTLGRSLDLAFPDWREDAKDTAIWNIERGFALTPDELLNSEQQRTKIYAAVTEFFQRHDVLALPAAQVPPFQIDQEWVSEIDGVALDTYIDWMAVCCMITVTGLPTLSIPAGLTQRVYQSACNLWANQEVILNYSKSRTGSNNRRSFIASDRV
jgi:amidase